ncbi:MAG TPA: hypothetical protein HPP83_12960 [Candidatus Hydrogenedentes bacterium]|nr:hypothetical protein [Candidatus Hydrogenedentota bacterium]
MESLILLIVGAAVLGLFTVINKVQEQIERERRRQTRESRLDASELPEATRRQLYGSPEGPPVARPAVRPAPGQQRREWRPPVAVPRGGRPVVPPPVPPPQRQAQPGQRRVPQPPGTPVLLREVLERATRREPIPAQARPVPAPRRPQPPLETVAKPAPRRRPPAPKQRRAAAPRPQPQRVPARPKRAGARVLFADLDDARRGIVMSEILGPPVSMR